MKTILTTFLSILSFTLLSQCDLYMAGGTYLYQDSLSDIKTIEVYCSMNDNGYNTVEFDFYGKEDTLFLESYKHGDRVINHYTIDYNLYCNKSYVVKKAVCYKGDSFKLKIKNNLERVKYIVLTNDYVLIKHKHGMFKNCYIIYDRYGS